MPHQAFFRYDIGLLPKQGLEYWSIPFFWDDSDKDVVEHGMSHLGCLPLRTCTAFLLPMSHNILAHWIAGPGPENMSVILQGSNLNINQVYLFLTDSFLHFSSF